ncbi:MAG: hypothetical protein COA94_05585 [Rickettsiales bacterium]|nr:MAG: hypothetical protein COA94_05585 [Rickettsiales bacterium]
MSRVSVGGENYGSADNPIEASVSAREVMEVVDAWAHSKRSNSLYGLMADLASSFGKDQSKLTNIMNILRGGEVVHILGNEGILFKCSCLNSIEKRESLERSEGMDGIKKGDPINSSKSIEEFKSFLEPGARHSFEDIDAIRSVFADYFDEEGVERLIPIIEQGNKYAYIRGTSARVVLLKVSKDGNDSPYILELETIKKGSQSNAISVGKTWQDFSDKISEFCRLKESARSFDAFKNLLDSFLTGLTLENIVSILATGGPVYLKGYDEVNILLKTSHDNDVEITGSIMPWCQNLDA